MSAPSRLVRRPLGWALPPAGVLRLLRADAHPVALCGAWTEGGDVIAAEPVTVRTAPGGRLADVLDTSLGDPGEAAGRGAFGGGWIGYLGYSAGGEALPATGPRALPAWWFGFYDHVLRRDRATGEWHFEALWTEERATALEERFAELSRRAAAPPGPARPMAGTATVPGAQACPFPEGQPSGPPGAEDYEFGPFRLIPGAERHQEAVAAAVDYIHQGDIFQANITLRAEADFAGDPLDAFCQGVTALDPPYAAYIGVSAPGAAPAAVASLSPELFLRRSGSAVTSKPIKGTARRAADEAEAAVQRAELEASAKNRAENVMIVDLVRNDLSRVCVPGSVTVPVLLGPEPHPGVWHLVSAVTGTLCPGASDGDLVRAAFPPGSVTGAPKVRALEIIDELETRPREAYTGAIGYRSPVAGLELNVAIRTFEFAAGKVWLGAGGGIVADSDPASEYAECLIKAAPLLAAVGGRLDASPAAAEPAGLPRPTAGVFSSLLVTDGATRGLDAHLARLRASVRDLYGKDLPPSLPADLAECLRAKPAGRLRITVRPVGGPLQSTIEVVPLASQLQPAATASQGAASQGSASQGTAAAGSAGIGLAPAAGPGVTLTPATVPGGIGGHKYRDRRLLGELAARVTAGGQVLLTDETGEILETDKCNVFAVIDGVLLTPPADGRLLPGTTRAAVLRAARERGILAGQKPLTLRELAGADEVFVTNAVVGVLPVTAIETLSRTWRPGPVTAALAAALAARAPDSPPTPDSPRVSGFPPALPFPQTSGSPEASGSRQAHGSPLAPWPPTLNSVGAVPPSAEPIGAVAHGAEHHVALRATAPVTAGGATAPRGHSATSSPHGPLVVLIDNYDSFTWNLAHLLSTAGARVEVVRNDEVTAAEVVAGAPAGVVISPGPCAPPEAGISIPAVTACAAANIPLLGICLGHQAIAAAFGARVVKAPSPVHGQAYPVNHDNRGVLAGLPCPFPATRYHSLIVDEATLPPDLVVTARTDGLPMALRHLAHPTEGVQFHPESILTTHGHTITENFVRSTVSA